MEKIENLLELLAQHGGKIVCTASLNPEEINQARASGRMHVDQYAIGFVWLPEIRRFPETEYEIEFFEQWYPLPTPLPPSLRNFPGKKFGMKDGNGRI